MTEWASRTKSKNFSEVEGCEIFLKSSFIRRRSTNSLLEHRRKLWKHRTCPDCNHASGLDFPHPNLYIQAHQKSEKRCNSLELFSTIKRSTSVIHSPRLQIRNYNPHLSFNDKSKVHLRNCYAQKCQFLLTESYLWLSVICKRICVKIDTSYGPYFNLTLIGEKQHWYNLILAN